jgi:hypothetical protein
MKALALWLLCLAFVPTARGESPTRRVIEPQPGAPLRVAAGERLQAVVEVASGLTPPPGVQTERALRGFAARACWRRGCRPLTVRNVRPVDAHSLRYRVEAPLPRDLSGGLYDLELRFPGGSGRVIGGLEVLPPARASDEMAKTRLPEPSGCAVSSVAGAPGFPGLLAIAVCWTLARRLRPQSTRGIELANPRSEGP